MLQRLSQTIGLTAAIYVALTRRKRTPVGISEINRILKEVWDSQKLENQLLGETMLFKWDDHDTHMAAHLQLATRPRATSVPNGWGVRWTRRRERLKRRRQDRFRRALSAIFLAPPR